MSSFKRMVSAFALLACGIGVSGVAHAQDKAGDKAGQPLAINYNFTNAIWLDIDVAIDKGFLKDEGFAPETIAFQNSPQAVQLLVTKSTQVAVMQPEAVLDADLKGAGLVALIQPETRPDWILVAPANADWKDIKGKTVGFSSLKVNEVWLTEKLLKAHGLGRDDWTGLQVGITPAKVAALTKGAIAASPLFQPGAQQALKSGLKAIARYDELGDCPPSLVVVSKAWATENQNGVRLIRALQKSHHWLYDAANRAETEEIMRKYTKVDADIAHDVYEMLFVTDKVYSRDGSIDLKGLKNAFQLITDAGEVAAGKIPAPETIILAKELGGVMH